MKRWALLSMTVVFVIYGAGVNAGWDMFIPLWMLLVYAVLFSGFLME